jgi:hypothetical protein
MTESIAYMTATARGDSLAYFRSMPAEERDTLGWFTARGNVLPAPFWSGGRLKRRPLDDEDGTVVFYKVGEDRGALRDDATDKPAPVLPTGPLHERADAYLRTLCAGYRVDPPSVADVLAYASVANDVTEDPIDPQEWLDDYIDARETVAGNRCQAIFGLLDRYARLDDESAQAVADLSEDARFASPCDPRVLVLVTHDGSAIVADLAGADVQTFGPTLTRRERRARRRRARRDWRRDWRLHRDARRAVATAHEYVPASTGARR